MIGKIPQNARFSELRFFLIMKKGKFKEGFLQVGDEFIGFLWPVRCCMEDDGSGMCEFKLIDPHDKAMMALSEIFEEGGRDE